MTEIQKVQSFQQALKTEAIASGLAKSALTLQVWCHGLAREGGWWEGVDPKDVKEGAVKISLMHSELSEALEALRKDLMDDHLPHRKGIECELVDALVRIFDYAGALELDLSGALVEKLVYNAERADHKLENRDKEGGKKF